MAGNTLVGIRSIGRYRGPKTALMRYSPFGPGPCSGNRGLDGEILPTSAPTSWRIFGLQWHEGRPRPIPLTSRPVLDFLMACAVRLPTTDGVPGPQPASPVDELNCTTVCPKREMPKPTGMLEQRHGPSWIAGDPLHTGLCGFCAVTPPNLSPLEATTLSK